MRWLAILVCLLGLICQAEPGEKSATDSDKTKPGDGRVLADVRSAPVKSLDSRGGGSKRGVKQERGIFQARITVFGFCNESKVEIASWVFKANVACDKEADIFVTEQAPVFKRHKNKDGKLTYQQYFSPCKSASHENAKVEAKDCFTFKPEATMQVVEQGKESFRVVTIKAHMGLRDDLKEYSTVAREGRAANKKRYKTESEKPPSTHIDPRFEGQVTWKAVLTISSCCEWNEETEEETYFWYAFTSQWNKTEWKLTEDGAYRIQPVLRATVGDATHGVTVKTIAKRGKG